MRIALFNLDCVATNYAIRSFLRRHRGEIAYVGLSPPFRAERGGVLRQSAKHLRRSGSQFSNFLGCNFLLPRLVHGARVALPIGKPAPTVADECRAAGVAVQRIANVNDAAVIEALARLDIDVIVSCYFDQIFRREILNVARLGAINVHSALLPQHRGPMPVIYSALDRLPTLGVTLHLIEEGIDTGPILAQEAYHAAPGESVLQSMIALHARGLRLVSELLPAIADGSATVQAQATGSYESFPDRSVIRELRRRGTPLFTWRDVRQAAGMAIGI